MTRKHFKWFVEWLSEIDLNLQQRDELCSFFKQMNPRFCKHTFEQALIKRKAEKKGTAFYD